ncbi:MAG: methionine aminotransferase [Bacteroidota bacterium]
MNQSFPASKLPQVGTTIFTVMSALARKHGAINLSQGFPDFPCDPKLPALVSEAMQKGFNQYAPMPGLIRLREEIAALTEDVYGASYHPESDITITSGATEGILCAITALVHPGDEVIVFEPAYDAYLPAIRLCGGIPVRISLQPPHYQIPWQEVSQKLSAKTRAIVINSPHNPTGTTLSKEDLDELEKLLAVHPALLISDEVYEHIVFDGATHQSIKLRPSLRNKALILSSFGKSLHATGWKVGYCLAPETLTKELRKVHQFVTFSTSTPFQYAIAEYLATERQALLDLDSFYQKKRDDFLELLTESRFRPLPCSGTYFQLMRYDAISDLNEVDFSQWLTMEKGVACIPVSAFYEDAEDHGIVRFCFAKENETLEKAAALLRDI